jgi:hypothetical protein
MELFYKPDVSMIKRSQSRRKHLPKEEVKKKRKILLDSKFFEEWGV